MRFGSKRREGPDDTWARLLSGGSLDSAPVIGGRVDLRGLVLAEPPVTATFGMDGRTFRQFNPLMISGAHWADIDLSGGRLPSLRFEGCTMENCVFDRCRFDDLRMWATRVVDCRFESAYLRGAGLGGVASDGTRNRFERTDFTSADLRDSLYRSADFVGCSFRNARLKKVDFEGSVFTRCVFEGLMDEVLFHRHGFEGEKFPPNEMRDVDFRKAAFRHVEFRGLDMDTVLWPETADHIVISDYRSTLARMVARLEGENDLSSRCVKTLLAFKLRWAGPKQSTGVVSTLELGTEGAIRRFRDLYREVVGNAGALP